MNEVLHNHPHGDGIRPLSCPACEARWIENSFSALEKMGWPGVKDAAWREPCDNLRARGHRPVPDAGAIPGTVKHCGAESCCMWA